MSFGKGAFTDRNGDYKQPTIVDMDKEYGKKKSYEKIMLDPEDTIEARKLRMDNFKKNQLAFIFAHNPFYAAKRFDYLIDRSSGKLEWIKDKVIEISENPEAFYSLCLILRKNVEEEEGFDENKDITYYNAYVKDYYDLS